MTTHVTRERLITFLLETPMFETLEPAEIRQLIHLVETREYEAGTILFREGKPGDAWYALYRGRVDVIKDTGLGKEEIYTLEPGACFGEIAILDGEPRSATIQALDDSVVLRISRESFEALLAEDSAIAHKLLHHMAIMLAQRARSTTERLSELLLEAEAAKVEQGVTRIVGESYVR